jgi:hypothetical protein
MSLNIKKNIFFFSMAGTRNKQTLGNFMADQRQVTKQDEWLMNKTSCMNDRPAFPVGINAPRMPASILANNSIDIETALFGIGTNNYIFRQKPVVPQPVHLPQVSFYESTPVYIPKLPDLLQYQRPL